MEALDKFAEIYIPNPNINFRERIVLHSEFIVNFCESKDKDIIEDFPYTFAKLNILVDRILSCDYLDFLQENTEEEEVEQEEEILVDEEEVNVEMDIPVEDEVPYEDTAVPELPQEDEKAEEYMYEEEVEVPPERSEIPAGEALYEFEVLGEVELDAAKKQGT